MTRRVLIGVAIFFAGIVVLVVAVSLPPDPIQPTATTSGSSRAETEERKPLFYRHPMNPSITSPVPAKDDMGMDYIPVYSDDSEPDDALVRISPAMQQNLGVRTAPVSQGPLARELETVGYVAFDERLQSHVNLRVSGWIEDLQVRTEGQRVKEGDLLFRVYSPELEIAQREFLETTSEMGAGLRDAGIERLKALGLTEADIQQLDRDHRPLTLVPVYARQDGILTELNAREGMFVTPGTTVMTLSGLESVWLLVDVFEKYADWIRTGQTAEVQLPHKPNLVLRGEVEFIYPQLDPETRTLKARVSFANPREMLRPGMYADVTVLADPREQTLSVPSEAVIRTGKESRVILARGGGGFEPVDVKIGLESGDRIEILGGLEADDEVVVSAQFLLDSEASLEASLRGMTSPPDEPGHGEDMEMDMPEAPGSTSSDSAIPSMDMDMSPSSMSKHAPAVEE